MQQFKNKTNYSGYAGEYGGAINTTIKPVYINQVENDVFNEDHHYDNRFIRPQITRFGEKIINGDPDTLKKYPIIEDEKIDLTNIKSGVVKRIININSASRETIPKNFYGDPILLDPYPLTFSNGSQKIVITHSRHQFQINDKISLTNIVGKCISLQNSISVKRNSQFIKINHPNHGVSLFGTFDPENVDLFEPIEYVNDLPLSYSRTDIITDGITQFYILKSNRNREMFIDISNATGVDNQFFIGNIPINFINKRHRMLLLFTKYGTEFVANPDSYLIELLTTSNTNYRDGNDGNSRIDIVFNFLHGIPLRYLNADYPISSNNRLGFHTIISTTDETYTINVEFPAIIDENTPYYNTNDTLDSNFTKDIVDENRGGGSQVIVREIIDDFPGFPNPNRYTIPLERTGHNVIEIKLISTEFPYTTRVISDIEGGRNNRLYWQNLDDGPVIYYLEITPGNYTITELEVEIENQFSKILRYQYSEEFINNQYDDLIVSLTPVDDRRYDDDGFSKYHNVSVIIDSKTDIVSFQAFRELNQQDSLDDRVINVPDGAMIISQDNTTESIITEIDDDFYIYFTEETFSGTFPYAYGFMYQYIELRESTITEDKYYVELNTDRAIIFDFYDGSNRQQANINTISTLSNFSFNNATKVVILVNHGLIVGDLFVTDLFQDPLFPNRLYVYKIVEVTTSDILKVSRFSQGIGPKFIFKNYRINFNPTVNYLDLNPNYLINAVNLVSNEKVFIVRHLNHKLDIGTAVVIYGSSSVNRIPSEAINREHLIAKVIDADHYLIEIDRYTPLSSISVSQLNIITIKYPDIFRMFFTYEDTIGNLLSFQRVGEENSITPYRNIIKNTDPYEIDIEYSALGTEFIPPLKKIMLTGFPYFYLVSRDIPLYQTTDLVDDVFAKIQLSGKIGSTLFDTFVAATKVFFTPISSLSELRFECRYPDNRLVDFNGVDHSFTLEITERYNDPPLTNINARDESEVFRN